MEKLNIITDNNSDTLIKQKNELEDARKMIKLSKKDPNYEENKKKRADIAKELRFIKKELSKTTISINDVELKEFMNLSKSIQHDTVILEKTDLSYKSFENEKVIILAKVDQHYTQVAKAALAGLMTIYSNLDQVSYLNGVKDNALKNSISMEQSLKSAIIYNVKNGKDISTMINPNVALIITMMSPLIISLSSNYYKKKILLKSKEKLTDTSIKPSS